MFLAKAAAGLGKKTTGQRRGFFRQGGEDAGTMLSSLQQATRQEIPGRRRTAVSTLGRAQEASTSGHMHV